MRAKCNSVLWWFEKHFQGMVYDGVCFWISRRGSIWNQLGPFVLFDSNNIIECVKWLSMPICRQIWSYQLPRAVLEKMRTGPGMWEFQAMEISFTLLFCSGGVAKLCWHSFFFVIISNGFDVWHDVVSLRFGFWKDSNFNVCKIEW